MSVEKFDRNLKMFEMHRSRKPRFTYRQIAGAFGLDEKTVWEIVDRMKKKNRKSKNLVGG